MAIQQFPRQFAGAYRILGGVAAGGVRKNGIALRGNHVQQVRLIRVLAQIGPTYCNSNNLRAAGLNGMARFHHVAILAGADQQPGLIYTPGDFEGFVFRELKFGCLCHSGPEYFEY